MSPRRGLQGGAGPWPIQEVKHPADLPLREPAEREHVPEQLAPGHELAAGDHLEVGGRGGLVRGE